MRIKEFNFIDENFGEKVGCVLILDENEFIIIFIQNEKISIKKYKGIKELIRELITNKSELEFLRNLVVEQQKELEELEGN